MLPPHDGAGGILAQAILEYTHMNLQSLQDVRDCRLASHTGRSPPFHLTLISSLHVDKRCKEECGCVHMGLVGTTGDGVSIYCNRSRIQ